MAGRRSTTAAALVGVLTLGLFASGCSPDSPAPAGPTPSASATEPPATPEPTVEPAAVEAPAPVAGDAIPADKVEELRESGVSVYVSPNAAGEGLVVEPGVALPEIVVNDIAATAIPAPAANIDEFAAQGRQIMAISAEMNKANMSAAFIMYAGNFASDGSSTGTQYVVDVYNVEGSQAFYKAAGDTRRDTKDAAVAAVQPLIDANPGLQVIDLTN